MKINELSCGYIRAVASGELSLVEIKVVNILQELDESESKAHPKHQRKSPKSEDLINLKCVVFISIAFQYCTKSKLIGLSSKALITRRRCIVEL